MNKTKERIQKKYELAKKEIDGERENANVLFRQRIKKHHLTQESWENTRKKERKYGYTDHFSSKILAQVIYMVLNDTNICDLSYSKALKVQADDIEDIQIREYFEFYLKEFRKEKRKIHKHLVSAFIQKNRLFGEQKTDSKETVRKKDEDIFLLISLMDTIKKKIPVIKIGFNCTTL